MYFSKFSQFQRDTVTACLTLQLHSSGWGVHILCIDSSAAEQCDQVRVSSLRSLRANTNDNAIWSLFCSELASDSWEEFIVLRNYESRVKWLSSVERFVQDLHVTIA